MKTSRKWDNIRMGNFLWLPFILAAIFTVAASAADLDIRILRVEFAEQKNSLTTGTGTFDSDAKEYKLDPKGARGSEAYWKNHIEFAKDYFSQASDGKTNIEVSIYPKKESSYKLKERIIDFNRTARKKGERVEAFDSARAGDYARFVDMVLELAKKDPDEPLKASSPLSKRVILIAHAGHSRLVDGGNEGIKAANTPGDFYDAYIDSTWGEFWRGFEVKAASETSEADSIYSVIVSSESASQDGLNWGINGTIVSQIGRELGLPYSYDIVKGFSRLGYFDGMDFAGSNAGNGFFPTLPSAWMRASANWKSVEEVFPKKAGDKIAVEICAASAPPQMCGGSPQIVKIPINNNEYILLENRQKTHNPNGQITVEMDNGTKVQIHVDSLNSYFLNENKDKQKYPGVIKSTDSPDAAIPASGIAAWRVNDWYVKELLKYGYGTVNAWMGDTFRDHQFGISLIEASGVLALGKEFKTSTGESAFYFGSGSDLIPHKRHGGKKDAEVNSINPSGILGYSNTASTFGGYSGLKITASVPSDGVEEKSVNPFTGENIITWRALKIKVEIEWVGKYAIPLQKEDWPYEPTDEDFAQAQNSESGYLSLDGHGSFNGKSYNIGSEKFLPIYADIDGDGFKEAVFLGSNRLYAVDSNGVPLQNFPALLSNGEPLNNFGSKPMAIDIDGDGSLDVLVPANNGLLLAVDSKGKLRKDEFPLAAGTFTYESDDKPWMLLCKHVSNDSVFLFAKHRGNVSAFYLPLAKAVPEKNIADKEIKDEISEFFIYPNPVRSKASMRFRILAPAKEATLELFDITGKKVFSKRISEVAHGSNQIEGLELSKLGSDVYTARLSVKFISGKGKYKMIRIAKVRD